MGIMQSLSLRGDLLLKNNTYRDGLIHLNKDHAYLPLPQTQRKIMQITINFISPEPSGANL